MRQRRGYVLVVTLGLLVLASTMLVTVGRISVRRALAAHQAQEELQRRWGDVSCRNAVLPRAGLLLSRTEQSAGRPVPILKTSIWLGDQNFTLILSDEQAKANVNSILETAEKSDAESRLRNAFGGTGLGNAIRLRPEPISDNRLPPAAGQPLAAPLPRISGPGQIFDNLPPERLIGISGSSPMDRITCWGNGAVNLMRATDPAMRLAFPSLSPLEIGRLIDARNQTFQGTRPTSLSGSPQSPVSANLDAVGRLLAAARIDPKIRSSAAFSSNSSCFSLWILAQDRRRTWYDLAVRDESDPRQPRTELFTW